MNKVWLGLILLCAAPTCFGADLSLEAIQVSTNDAGDKTYSLSLQVLGIMTFLTLMPALILMMTSFTRIIIVLSILRQALGMPQTPSNQIIIGLSLFLSFFIMSPIFDQVYQEGIAPYMNEELTVDEALEKGIMPMKTFMYNQTRTEDMALFVDLADQEMPLDAQDTKLSILIPAFVTSELKTAFQIGFIIFIPFLIIDLVVASVLMAMGMMMLSPLIISLPFKIMLFVLVDGWSLLMGTLAASFGVG